MRRDTRTIFYVYQFFRADGTTPMYIGKGKGKRWLDHERDAKRGLDNYNPHLYNAIRQILALGIAVPKLKVAEGLTEEEALILEAKQILEIGRANLGTGPLLNLTDGGEGTCGAVRSQETRDLLRVINLNRPPVSAETGRKISKALTGKKHPPEFGEAISKRLLGKKRNLSPKGRQAIIDSNHRQKGKMSKEKREFLAGLMTPERQKRQQEARAASGYTHSEETKTKIGQANSIHMNKPEKKAHMSKVMSEYSNQPEVRKKRSKDHLQWYKDNSEQVKAAGRKISQSKKGKKMRPEIVAEFRINRKLTALFKSITYFPPELDYYAKQRQQIRSLLKLK